jgi:2-amino-4-hydroxy-6-hydroxymethyldihydropteridine diphosphokinase
MAGCDRLTATVAYIGLGSNLADPRAQVLRAIAELAEIPGCTLCRRSSLYATAPVGPVDQPDFVNAAAAIATPLAPAELLAALQGIERAHGRVRDGARWGPRTLDLDLLVYGELMLRAPDLELPHPEIRHRAFVLVPLAEIAPESLLIPGQGHLFDLLDGLRDPPMVRLIPDADPPTGASMPSPLSWR